MVVGTVHVSEHKPDFLIIGGGLAGVAAAYHLSRQGASVELVEAGGLGSGTTSACSGRAQLIEARPLEYLRLVYSGYQKVASLAEELDCRLEWEEPGHLTLLKDQDEWVDFEQQVSCMNTVGASAEMLDLPALQAAEPYLNPGEFIGAALSLEGHVNIFEFCHGYANAARRLGVRIHTNMPVTAFEAAGRRVNTVICGGKQISPGKVIFATGAWTARVVGLLGIDFPMHFTQAEALVSEPLPRVINRHVGMTGFYKAVHGGRRAITLGVGQHKNGTLVVSNAIQPITTPATSSSYWGMPSIVSSLVKYFPVLAGVQILRTWSAPSPFLPDSNPAIGWLPHFDNLYIAAGFHLAVPTIPLLSEQIVSHVCDDKMPAQLEPFSPSRFYQ